MKNIILILLTSAAFSINAQEINPFESIGKEGKILTLSKGKYTEVHINDSLQRIGSVIVNMNTGTIYELLNTDTLYSEATLDPTVISRWYSTDPLAAKYPGLSPYNFVGNSPIMFVDPDGKKIRPVNSGAESTMNQLYSKYSSLLWNSERGTRPVNDDLVYSTNMIYDRKRDLKRAMRRSDSDFTEADLEEAWALYNGLNDPEILELQVLQTEVPGHQNTREYSQGKEGAKNTRFDMWTENAYYEDFIYLLNLNNTEDFKQALTQKYADALYKGDPLTVTKDETGESVTFTVVSDDKGEGWVYFKNDNIYHGKTKGMIIIDKTNNTNQQIFEKFSESINTVLELNEQGQ